MADNPRDPPAEAEPDVHKLSAGDKQKLVEWLQEKSGGQSECPVCKTGNWIVGDHLFSGSIYAVGGGLVIGGTSYPQAFTVCDTCFYVRTFMAVPIGLDFFKSEEADG